MASWKDGIGQYTWGTYLNTATYDDIAIVGGAHGGGSDYFGIPDSEMDDLRSREYGTGIHFWRDGNKINITVNLIIISTRNNSILRNGYYIGNSSADYKFFANIQYKTKQGNWVELGDNEISTYHGGDPMYDKAGWDTQKSGYLWKTFTFDLDLSNISQFSIGIHGEGNEIRKWNYYNVEEVFKVYTKRLTIRYLNKQTRDELRLPYTVDVLENAQYRDTAPNINGYTAENPDIDIFMVNDTEHIVWYVPTNTTATVRYLDRLTNRPLQDDTRLDNLTIGQAITMTAPSIPEYTPEQSQFVYYVTGGTNIITFYYRKVPKIRAWAIRQSGRWNSLLTIDRHFRIRKSGTMITTANEDIASADVGRENYSASRIRKSGSWKAQGKVGD